MGCVRRTNLTYFKEIQSTTKAQTSPARNMWCQWDLPAVNKMDRLFTGRCFLVLWFGRCKGYKNVQMIAYYKYHREYTLHN